MPKFKYLEDKHWHPNKVKIIALSDFLQKHFWADSLLGLANNYFGSRKERYPSLQLYFNPVQVMITNFKDISLFRLKYKQKMHSSMKAMGRVAKNDQ